MIHGVAITRPSSIPLMMIALISLVMSRTLVVMQRPTHSHRYGVKPIDSNDDRGEQADLVLFRKTASRKVDIERRASAADMSDEADKARRFGEFLRRTATEIDKRLFDGALLGEIGDGRRIVALDGLLEFGLGDVGNAQNRFALIVGKASVLCCLASRPRGCVPPRLISTSTRRWLDLF